MSNFKFNLRVFYGTFFQLLLLLGFSTLISCKKRAGIQQGVYESKDLLNSQKVEVNTISSPINFTAKQAFYPSDKRNLQIKASVVEYSPQQLTGFSINETDYSYHKSNISLNCKPLGLPLRVKASLPQMKQYASRSVLSFNLDQGLPGMVVKCMLQDNYGFLWLGTDNGLCRFNGDYFDVYNTTHGGLSSNVILSICSDNAGNIWAGTDGGGFLIINAVEQTIMHYGSEIITKIKEWPAGKIHMAVKNKGYCFIDASSLKNNKTLALSQWIVSTNEGNAEIRDFTFDDKGHIWLAGNEGLWLINKGENDKMQGKCQHVTIKNHENKVYCIEQVKEKVWAGTKELGLLVLQFIDGKLTIEQCNTNNGLSCNSILDLEYDKHSNVMLLGTDGCGLDCISLKLQGNQKMLYQVTNYSLNEGLQDDEVCSILRDNKGGIWMGYYGGGGLSVLQSKGNEWTHLTEHIGLKSSTVNCFFEDKEDNIWLGTSGSGCEIISPSYDCYNLSTQNGLNDSEINCISADAQNRIWIGTAYAGINIIDQKQQKIMLLNEQNGLNSNSVKCLLKDEEKIWIGTEKGLNIFDLSSKQLMKLNFSSKSEQAPVMSLVKGPNHDVWVGTYGDGVFKLIFSDTAKYFASKINVDNGLPSNEILSLFCSKGGTLFIGTDGHGLISLEAVGKSKDNYLMRVYDESVGLSDNSVLSLTASADALYAGTAKGLSKLSLKSGAISCIDKQDGLAALDFNNNAALTDRKGRLWWGIGSVVSNMRPYLSKPESSNCYIYDVEVNDSLLKPLIAHHHEIKHRKGIRTKAPVGIIDNLDFPYQYNHFTFHFTGMQIVGNNKTAYAYQLEGVDTSYTERLNENSAEYRNLNPGKYTFKVRSKGHQGNWSTCDSFTFRILPPWYKTIWAFAIYFVILILILRLYFLWRLNYLKEQNEKLKKAVDLQTKEIKSKNDQLQDSIKSAQGLQESILPEPSSLRKLFPQSYLMYLPKDIVAGDFYWWHQQQDLIFITVADCTGHGVQGALLTVICINAINKAVIDEKLQNPGEILDRLIQLVTANFINGERKEGMDLSFCVINKKQNKLYWAGANNPLWISRNDGSFFEIKADKQAIGAIDQSVELKKFKTHEIELFAGDIIHLFTDGFADQFGGTKDLPKGKKLKYKNFMQALKEPSDLSMQDQADEIEKFFNEWKGSIEQTDDVCVMGIKV